MAGCGGDGGDDNSVATLPAAPAGLGTTDTAANAAGDSPASSSDAGSQEAGGTTADAVATLLTEGALPDFARGFGRARFSSSHQTGGRAVA